MEAKLLLIHGFVPPVTEKKGDLLVVMKRLHLVGRQAHDDGTIQACGSLHPEMAMVEICSCLQNYQSHPSIDHASHLAPATVSDQSRGIN